MIIEQAHLVALWDENEITIAEAEAAGSRSTAAAYAAQQLVIRRFNQLPDISELPPEAPTWASEPITIEGFAFQNCPVEGCNIMTDSGPCPVHEGARNGR